MISENEEKVLTIALSNERIASEIVARVIDATPANAAAAQAILDVITPSEKESKEIEEYLIVALTNRNVGKEIAGQLELIVECLEYQAADSTANNAALNAAQALLVNLSDQAREYLVVALANKLIAESIADQIDLASQSAAAIADAV